MMILARACVCSALREITARCGRTLVVCTAGCPSCLTSYLTLQVAEVSFG